jgi:hypothetical protein
LVLADSRGRIWLTVHTRRNPWTLSVNEKTPDGYIGLLDEDGARIVADGFIGTNEVRVDTAEEWLLRGRVKRPPHLPAAGRPRLGGGRGRLAPMMASVTFGGPDLRSVYLGSLMGQTLPSFRSPVPGLPMAHWHRHA